MKLSTSTFQNTLKSQDTEEWIDLLVYRPAGYCWALFFKRMKIRPNTVTLFSILSGIASGVMFYFTDLRLNIVGMLLLIWANTYDSADGQLARMTGQYSRAGRILDGAAGEFWFISIYAGICLRLTPTWGLWIWLLAAVTGYFHGKQAAMADYLRNFHLLIVKGKSRSELDDYSVLKEQLKSLTWKNNFIEKFYLTYYTSYTKDQEDRTPELQNLRATMKEKFGDSELPSGVGEEFRLRSRPMMKYTNILSFNTRSFALFASLFAGLPWIYFVFEVTVLNILLIYMLHKYENICKRFNLRLRGND
ncbi:MAG: CDP-alcohol phosphatidyltransferase family protein [Tannerella sp.]|jgi:hypothetical protein|nr:CDP-alcohol phosphatidyltransferase family protein [Tannerella sp.]